MILHDSPRTPWALLAALVVAGCGPVTESVSTDVCASGTRWVGGESEDDRMHPGRDCIDCHSRGEGPGFMFAGTVFSVLDASDDCFGLEGVEIRLTGADGKVITARSNSAGNFYRRGNQSDLARPYTATITYQGVETSMTTPQTESSCGSCHTKTGANAAPGRISPSQLWGGTPPATTDGGTGAGDGG
jgi:hypothetical protein